MAVEAGLSLRRGAAGEHLQDWATQQSTLQRRADISPVPEDTPFKHTQSRLHVPGVRPGLHHRILTYHFSLRFFLASSASPGVTFT
jgi:hypothetical protein